MAGTGRRPGLARLLDLFARHRLTATCFVPAYDAERYPAAMTAIVDGGHEVAGRGDRYEDFSLLEPAEQAAVLDRSEAAFHRVFNRRPAGWRAPDGLMTAATRPLLAERGYRWESSFCDDDLPYVVTMPGGQRLVEIPCHATASDAHYYLKRRAPGVVAEAWLEDLGAVYAAGGLFTLQLCPRADYGSGRPVRLPPVDTILRALRETPRLWVATCGEIAEWLAGRMGEGATP